MIDSFHYQTFLLHTDILERSLNELCFDIEFVSSKAFLARNSTVYKSHFLFCHPRKLPASATMEALDFYSMREKRYHPILWSIQCHNIIYCRFALKSLYLKFSVIEAMHKTPEETGSQSFANFCHRSYSCSALERCFSGISCKISITLIF